MITGIATAVTNINFAVYSWLLKDIPPSPFYVDCPKNAPCCKFPSRAKIRRTIVAVPVGISHVVSIAELPPKSLYFLTFASIFAFSASASFSALFLSAVGNERYVSLVRAKKKEACSHCKLTIHLFLSHLLGVTQALLRQLGARFGVATFLW